MIELVITIVVINCFFKTILQKLSSPLYDMLNILINE